MRDDLLVVVIWVETPQFFHQAVLHGTSRQVDIRSLKAGAIQLRDGGVGPAAQRYPGAVVELETHRRDCFGLRIGLPDGLHSELSTQPGSHQEGGRVGFVPSHHYSRRHLLKLLDDGGQQGAPQRDARPAQVGIARRVHIRKFQQGLQCGSTGA